MDLFSSGAEWGDEGKGQGPQGRGLFPGTEEGLGDKEAVIPIAGVKVKLWFPYSPFVFTSSAFQAISG